MPDVTIQQPTMIPAVWVYTTGDFNAFRPEGYSPFLSPEQQARLERIRQGRMLFDGKHRDYFINEHRTQFDFPRTRVGTTEKQMYLPNNLLKLISYKGTDLLFGAEPLLRVDDEAQQQSLADLVERSNLHQLFYNCAVDATYEAESLIEACIHGGAVYLRAVAADEIFPVGTLQPDGQYLQYDQYRIANIGVPTAAIYLVLTISYVAGSINRTLKQIDDKGRVVAENLDLAEWPLAAGEPPLQPATNTGIAWNTITWIPNQLIRGQAVSDYDGIVELQDELNAKQTQIARVLAKHSDPKLAAPASSADPQGNARSDYDVYFYRTKDEIPSYVTWDAELASAVEDRDFARESLLIAAETSPVLLGIRGKSGGHAEAFRTVRVQAYNSLTKAGRKAVVWKAGIRRCVKVAQMLERSIPGYDYADETLGVVLRDGMPVDTLDQANEIAIKRGVGVMSVHRALMEQMDDPAAVEAEEKEIEAETAAKTPSIFLGGPTPDGQESGTPPMAAPGNPAAAAQDETEVGT